MHRRRVKFNWVYASMSCIWLDSSVASNVCVRERARVCVRACVCVCDETAVMSRVCRFEQIIHVILLRMLAHLSPLDQRLNCPL